MNLQRVVPVGASGSPAGIAVSSRNDPALGGGEAALD
jgi:hypothetical protein